MTLTSSCWLVTCSANSPALSCARDAARVGIPVNEQDERHAAPFLRRVSVFQLRNDESAVSRRERGRPGSRCGPLPMRGAVPSWKQANRVGVLRAASLWPQISPSKQSLNNECRERFVRLVSKMNLRYGNVTIAYFNVSFRILVPCRAPTSIRR